MSTSANLALFNEIDIQGSSALFSELRILRESVPKPLCVYEVRHSDEDWTEPAQITRGVLVNFLGTLITAKPLRFPNGHSMYLEEGEVDFYSDKVTTLSQFIQENNIRLRPPKAPER